jgi:hypothetical protein
MDAKKQVELRYLDVVRRGIDDFPGGNITDTECPDFLIQFLDRTVGVEITRIFNPGKPKSPPPQSQDTERDLIAERAQAIATDQSLAPVMVDIYFDSRQSIGKRDRDSIAQQLVDLVAANMPALGDDRLIEKHHPTKLEFLLQIEAVHIWRFKPLTSHLWQTADAGIVNEDFAPYLQQLIDDKNGKVSTYRQKCDDCWLMVVADWRGPSAFFEISDKMSSHNYESAFDRVYFVEGYSGRVVALNTSPNVG